MCSGKGVLILMLGMSYEQIVEKIKIEKGLSEEEINSKVKKKCEQFSELISKEGAAHIIANELGVRLFEKISKRFKIKNLSPMLRNIEVAAKVIRLYEIRSFKTEKREGRLAAMLVGDETANIRVVVWDEKLIKQIEEKNIKEDDVIVIRNAYVRENNGFKELHLGSGSVIEVNPVDVKVNIAEKSQSFVFEKKKIIDLKEGDLASINGIVVQLFEPRFYEACPECGKKLLQENGKFICKEHSTVAEVSVAPVINLFVDDGSDNIRVVCFKNQAEKILSISNSQILDIKTDMTKFQDVKANVLGSQFVISGRVKKNEMFDRLELSAISVEEANPEKLIEELVK